ncbi:hypothetical protein [Bdellovibrio sp. HCB209]|uniref:hypothetical protein n=1 Tax=Bdellovibrio sp. HCB209 TaxID=3394354 RepID=UPI0039B66E30
MKQSILAITALFISVTTHARSTEFGNGGNAVVCPRGESEAYEYVKSYDLTEAIIRYRLLPVLPDWRPSQCQIMKDNREICDTGMEVAEDFISRLKKIDPVLHQSLHEKVLNFWSEAILIHGDLLPVNDTGLSFIDRGCSLEQLAIQHEPLFDEDSRYFISMRLWEKMEQFDRGIMILHEVLYREALEQNPALRSSEKIRYFNALLISNEVSKLSPDKYLAVKAKVFNP